VSFLILHLTPAALCVVFSMFWMCIGTSLAEMCEAFRPKSGHYPAAIKLQVDCVRANGDRAVLLVTVARELNIKWLLIAAGLLISGFADQQLHDVMQHNEELVF
jgi:hypothetical protein